jgi:hypothetical protein
VAHRIAFGVQALQDSERPLVLEMGYGLVVVAGVLQVE